MSGNGLVAIDILMTKLCLASSKAYGLVSLDSVETFGFRGEGRIA